MTKAVVADYRYRVLCVRIVPVSGSPVYFTSHVRDLAMSGHTYLSSGGYQPTALPAHSDFSPAALDLNGLAQASGISLAQIAAGHYDNARIYIFATTWRAPAEDEEPLELGFLGKTQVRDQRYVAEMMSAVDALNQTAGRAYAASCHKAFGGQEYAGCMVDLAPITVTGTLSAVTSSSVFRDATRAEVADYFGEGLVSFTSGANAGIKAREIKRHEADGTLEVHEAFPYLPAIGDAYTLIPGCRKRLEDCRDKWNNIANSGGLFFVPQPAVYAEVGGRA